MVMPHMHHALDEMINDLEANSPWSPDNRHNADRLGYIGVIGEREGIADALNQLETHRRIVAHIDYSEPLYDPLDRMRFGSLVHHPNSPLPMRRAGQLTSHIDDHPDDLILDRALFNQMLRIAITERYGDTDLTASGFEAHVDQVADHLMGLGHEALDQLRTRPITVPAGHVGTAGELARIVKASIAKTDKQLEFEVQLMASHTLHISDTEVKLRVVKAKLSPDIDRILKLNALLASHQEGFRIAREKAAQFERVLETARVQLADIDVLAARRRQDFISEYRRTATLPAWRNLLDNAKHSLPEYLRDRLNQPDVWRGTPAAWLQNVRNGSDLSIHLSSTEARSYVQNIVKNPHYITSDPISGSEAHTSSTTSKPKCSTTRATRPTTRCATNGDMSGRRHIPSSATSRTQRPAG